MSCTCLLNRFRDSTRMEPRVLVTLGWFRQPSSSSEFWPKSDVRSAFFVSACCFYAIVRPYRLNYKNTVDILALVLHAILSLTFPTSLYHPLTVNITWCILVSTLLLGVPHMALICFLCYKLATVTGITHCLKCDPSAFTLTLLGILWIQFQVFAINFITEVKVLRAEILLNSP